MRRQFCRAGKLLCALVLTLAVCAGFAARAEGIPRTARVSDMRDVPADAYYAEAVDWALVNGIANGTGEDTFSPEQICTRAHVVTFLWRAAGEPEPHSAANPFADVAESSYYYKPVLWAVERGITNGTGNNAFSPSSQCTREQILTFLHRAAGEPRAAQNVSAGHGWSAAALAWAQEKGLSGVGDAAALAAGCTRADTVYFLYRTSVNKLDGAGCFETYVPAALSGGVYIAANGQELTSALLTLIAAYDGTVAAAGADADYVSGRLIVRTTQVLPPLAQYRAAQVIAGPDGCCFVQFASAADAESCAAYLRALAQVEYVEPDALLRTCDTGAADGDTDFAALTGIGAYAAALGARGTDTNITVAVVDSGADDSHGSLSGRLARGYDFVGADARAEDTDGHGTHAAGVIAACTQGTGVKIMPIRVVKNGTAYVSLAAQGVRYAAEHGAAVVELALCGAHSNYLEDAVDYALGGGVTVVAAAGSEGKSAVEYCPAHIAGCITVAAVDAALEHPAFSNYGSCVDVCAPGEGIRSCVPGGGFESRSGTAAAASQTAAACALLLCDRGAGMMPHTVERLLRTAARDLGYAPYFGAGLLDLTPFIDSYSDAPTPAAKVYMVAFDPCGGTVQTPSMRVNAGEPFGSLPTPVRDGWRFDGWYTAVEGGQHARDIDLPGSDLILYAHWTRLDAIVYSVSFDPCGGTVSPAQIQASADKPFGTLPTPVRDGWLFEGWYTERDGGQYVREIDYPGSNLILYAHWKQSAETQTPAPEPAPEPVPEPTSAPGGGASCGAGLDWSLSAGTLTVFGNGAMYDYASPEETPWASERRTIRAVVVAPGVTHIGDYAFCNCTALSSVQLPAQLDSIGIYAFAGCPFQSLDLTGSIGSIGARAFEGCGVISLTLSGNIGNIGSNAFARCGSLTLLEISGEVNRIGTGAFEDCNSLWSVTITGRVNSIDATAFPEGTTIYRG